MEVICECGETMRLDFADALGDDANSVGFECDNCEATLCGTHTFGEDHEEQS